MRPHNSFLLWMSSLHFLQAESTYVESFRVDTAEIQRNHTLSLTDKVMVPTMNKGFIRKSAVWKKGNILLVLEHDRMAERPSQKPCAGVATLLEARIQEDQPFKGKATRTGHFVTLGEPLPGPVGPLQNQAKGQ